MDLLKINTIPSGLGQKYLDGKYFVRQHAALPTVHAAGEDTATRIEIMASSYNDPELLLLLLQSPQASSVALTEIASHPANYSCWDTLIKHCNATPFHLELLLEYEYEYDFRWFELEKAIAKSDALNDEVAEIIFLRNAEHKRDYRYFSRKFSERRLILYTLANNKNVSETLKANCVTEAFPQELPLLRLLQKTA